MLTNHPYYIEFKSVILVLKIGGLMLSTHEKLTSVSHTFFDGYLVATCENYYVL